MRFISWHSYNHYRDMTNWKPFHHDAAGLDKDAGKGKGKGGGKGRGGGDGGGKGGRPPMCEVQNMTVGVSFGEARQAAFEWAGAREKDYNTFPEHLRSPAVNPGSHKNVVLSLTLPDSSTYTFGRDVNLLWKHGILAEKPPSGKASGGRIDVEEGRISIIAWGWVDQYDELERDLDDGNRHRITGREEGRGGARGGEDKDVRGRGRAGVDDRGRGGWEGERERDHERRGRSRSRSRSRSPRRDRPDRDGRHRKDEQGAWRSEEERGGRDRHARHGWSAGPAAGVDSHDPDEAARRAARAAKFGTQL